MSNIGKQVRVVKRKPEPKDRLKNMLDKNMIETYRGKKDWGSHKVVTKYIGYNCTDEEWARIFNGG